MAKQLYTLSNVVLPPLNFSHYKDLFYRYERIVESQGKIDIYQFDTWMNLFGAKKWYEYCDLGELYLKLNVTGAYHLQVSGVNFNHVTGVSDTILLDIFIDADEYQIAIPDAKNYTGIYFSIRSKTNEQLVINSIAWCTDKAPVVENKLAIVSCTFKREAYIANTIAKLEAFLNENKALRDKMHFFVIDNGKTLDAGTHYNYTEIIPNINAGGAGGFTRGMMEAVKSDAGYTRILLMDDDIDVLPESIFRTFQISNYLRDEYRDASISGAMMSIFAKHWLFEALAVQNEFWCRPVYANMDVFRIGDVMKIDSIQDDLFSDEKKKVHAAWWYNCFPVSCVEEKGLALPFFIRCDDMEFGWRHQGKHIITMNGIGVWHEPFEWKTSQITRYFYGVRNAFIIWAIYIDGFKNEFAKYLKKMFYQELLETYNYNDIDILFKAFDDILTGTQALKQNPEQLHKELQKLVKKPEYFEATESELEAVKLYYPKMTKRKIVYNLTLRGKYCPQFIWKKESKALERFPAVKNFMLAKTVKVYNLLTGKYCVRKYDRKLAIRAEKEFKARIRKLEERFDDLKKDYTDAHKELTSFAFWEKYLELPTEKNTKGEKRL
jgi:GT2 family glycosyltransferase